MRAYLQTESNYDVIFGRTHIRLFKYKNDAIVKICNLYSSSL